jgi:hypothetical protein
MARPLSSIAASLPKGVLWAGALFCLAGLFSSNPLLTVASVAALLAMFTLLWRPGEPPVLFYAIAYQWLQATILVFSADLQGLALDDLDHRLISLQGGQTQVYLEPATWLTLAGLLAVSLGMRLAAGPPTGQKMLGTFAAATANISPNRAFAACILSMAAASFIESFLFLLPGLSQPLLALANLHWVIVYIFTYVVLTQQRGYAALALIFTMELGVGFLGFFSEFKTVLVVMLLAALSIPMALRGRRLWVAGAIVALMVVFGTVWSAIKVEYRDFLNQGTKDQVVLVSKSQQIEELGRLLGDFDRDRFAQGAGDLVRRLTYVYFFSEAMQMVPKFIPHEEGALWGDAIYRTLVPRLLDPDKTAIDDSERTAEYTGLQIIGGDHGTSVSMGYVAESYIDFGPIFMMLPLCLWGSLVGYAYRSFTWAKPHALFSYGCVTIVVLMNASVLEQSNAKMVAGVVMSWLVMYFAHKYGAPAFMRALELRAADRVRAAPGATEPPTVAAGRRRTP